MDAIKVHVVPETGFRWSDAWVLASVAIGGGLKGARLRDIIAASELINSATVEARELRDGLGKLMYRGYVERTTIGFVIAGRARSAVESVLQAGPSSFGVMQFFEDLLNVEAYGIDSSHVDGTWPVDGVSDEEVRAATAAYRDDIHGIWREMRAIDHAPLPERALHLLAMAGKGATV
jgi:hypothetical protein